MGFIALIGMLNVFETRFIITDLNIQDGLTLPGLALSTVILIGVLLGAGLLAARRLKAPTSGELALNGALAGAVTILLMIAIVFVAQQINVWAESGNMSAIFPNVNADLTRLLSFGQETPLVGYVLMTALGALVGAAGGLGLRLPTKYISVGLIAVTIIVALGMLQDQVNTIISLTDAIWITGLITLGYLVAAWRKRPQLWPRIAEAAAVGAVLGLLGGLLLVLGGAQDGALPAFLDAPAILTSLVVGRGIAGSLILLAIIGGILGLAGAVLSATTGTAHRLGTTVLAALLMLGVLNATDKVTYVSALIIIVMIVVQQLIAGQTAQQADSVYSQYAPRQRRTSQTLIGLVGLAFVLIIPQFLSGYINNVVDLIGLYVMMGLGLNIVVGFAGLLDLGYVAFFAIGAYMTGILTTPNVLTCGGIGPSAIPAADIATTCTGMLTFWMAWPIAILTSGLAGVTLGIPVLRLRGDYLAIVTLGFGEIIRLVALSDLFKPFFGGAQGIVGIPGAGHRPQRHCRRADRGQRPHPDPDRRVVFRTDLPGAAQRNLLPDPCRGVGRRLRLVPPGWFPPGTCLARHAQRRGRGAGDGHPPDAQQAAGLLHRGRLLWHGRGAVCLLYQVHLPQQLHAAAVDQRAEPDHHRRPGQHSGRDGGRAAHLRPAGSAARVPGIPPADVRRAAGGDDDPASRGRPAALDAAPGRTGRKSLC